MIWTCKKCGGEIIGIAKGTFKSGWGYLNRDGDIKKLEEYDVDYGIIEYKCEDCGATGERIVDVAEWK